MNSYKKSLLKTWSDFSYLLVQVLLQQQFGLLLWSKYRALLLCSIREMVLRNY